MMLTTLLAIALTTPSGCFRKCSVGCAGSWGCSCVSSCSYASCGGCSYGCGGCSYGCFRSTSYRSSCCSCCSYGCSSCSHGWGGCSCSCSSFCSCSAEYMPTCGGCSMGCSAYFGATYSVPVSAYSPIYTSATAAPSVPTAVRSESLSPIAPDLTPVASSATAEKPVVVYYNN
jgi:hypothetical protein